jgi:hypothetical protein
MREHCTLLRLSCNNTNYIFTQCTIYKCFRNGKYCFSTHYIIMYKWIGNSHYCTAGIKKSDGIEQLRTYKSLKSCSVAVSLYDIENCGIPDPGLCWVGSDQHSRHLELLYCLGGASPLNCWIDELFPGLWTLVCVFESDEMRSIQRSHRTK